MNTPRTLEVKKEDYASGIVSLFDKVAEYIGETLGKDDKYDCTKLDIAKNIQDSWFEMYREQGYTDSDVCMLLLFTGPKVNESLSDNQVQVYDGYIIRG